MSSGRSAVPESFIDPATAPEPLVSIVTVSYNSAATIRDTIESVLRQSHPRIEYIVVDGRSTDGTAGIAREYEDAFAARGMRYLVVSERDEGIYDAMNKGVRMTTGALVGIINSDDWYEDDAVSKVARTWRERPFDMFYADLRLVRADGSTLVKRSRHDRIATSRHWNHPTTFIARAVYDRFLYKRESIHDDFDLFLRIRKAGLRIVILNEVLANFRVGGVSNDKSLARCYTRFKARYRIYRNNGYSRLYVLECLGIEVAKFILS